MAERNQRVIDLSHWNTIPQSLQPAATSGIWGVIHKASEGAGGLDDKYPSRNFLAREAGLLFGAYHFLRPGDQRAHARSFVEYVWPDEGLLLAADHEDSRVSLSDLLTWLQEVERLTGVRPVIYSGHVLKDQLAGKRHATLNEDNYLLWLAQYASSPVLPPGWGAYWLWQWSQEGSVPGIDPPVDLNDYRGSRDDLAASWTKAPQPQPEPPEPVPGYSITPEAFQAALKEAGFYAGEVDGLSGPMTREAVDAWFAEGGPLPVVFG